MAGEWQEETLSQLPSGDMQLKPANSVLPCLNACHWARAGTAPNTTQVWHLMLLRHAILQRDNSINGPASRPCDACWVSLLTSLSSTLAIDLELQFQAGLLFTVIWCALSLSLAMHGLCAPQQ
jgi:hypothetical protein